MKLMDKIYALRYHMKKRQLDYEECQDLGPGYYAT